MALPPAFRAVMESACARLREEIMRLEMQDMAAQLAALRSRVEALEAHHRVE
jgi:hypothetical protein